MVPSVSVSTVDRQGEAGMAESEPKYELDLLYSVLDEFEAEIATQAVAGEIPEMLLESCGLPTAQAIAAGTSVRLPSAGSKRLENSVLEMHTLIQAIRERPRLMIANRAGLLHSHRQFTAISLPARFQDAGLQPGLNAQGPLTLRPELLEPERLALQQAANARFGTATPSKSRPRPEQLLRGPAHWPGDSAANSQAFETAWTAFVTKVANLATPLELWSLGLWHPDQAEEISGATVQRAFESLPAQPSPLPAQTRLLELLWQDDELVCHVDRRANLTLGFAHVYHWWRNDNKHLITRVNPRRVEAVTAVISELAGVVTRNCRKWVHTLPSDTNSGQPDSSWRGYVWRSASGRIKRHLKGMLVDLRELEVSRQGHETESDTSESGLEEWASRSRDKRQNSHPITERGAGASGTAPSSTSESAALKLAQLVLLATKTLTLEQHTVLALRTNCSHDGGLPRVEVARLLQITPRQVELIEAAAKTRLRKAAFQLPDEDLLEDES